MAAYKAFASRSVGARERQRVADFQAAGRCSHAIATWVARRASCTSPVAAAFAYDSEASRQSPRLSAASAVTVRAVTLLLGAATAAGFFSVGWVAAQAPSTAVHRSGRIKLRTRLIILSATIDLGQGARIAQLVTKYRHPGECAPAETHEGIHPTSFTETVRSLRGGRAAAEQRRGHRG